MRGILIPLALTAANVVGLGIYLMLRRIADCLEILADEARNEKE